MDPEHPPLIEIAQPIGLLSAAQMNVIEFHTWNALKTRIHTPDRIVFDLDPGSGVKWSTVREVAMLMRTFLRELKLPSFLKTSGGKGLHVVTPIRRHYDWDTVKAFSRSVVEHIAHTVPRLVVAKSGAQNRVGKVYIDILRNGFGATTATAWSLRARPGLGVSIPITWEELDEVQSGADWTIRNVGSRLETENTPWKGYDKASASITAAMKRLSVRRFKAPD